MVNTPGTVDAGFRGELQVILINHDLTESVSFKKGDRIAQLVIQKVERAQFVEVADLPGSERATGGFGSTGA
jgi:dUTP pyrophosphatase